MLISFCPAVLGCGTRHSRRSNYRRPNFAAEVLEFRCLLSADSPWQNPTDPLDVSGDGIADSFDAFVVIFNLSTVGPVDLSEISNTPPPFVNVNGDNQFDFSDFLAVVDGLEQRDMLNPPSESPMSPPVNMPMGDSDSLAIPPPRQLVTDCTEPESLVVQQAPTPQVVLEFVAPAAQANSNPSTPISEPKLTAWQRLEAVLGQEEIDLRLKGLGIEWRDGLSQEELEAFGVKDHEEFLEKLAKEFPEQKFDGLNPRLLKPQEKVQAPKATVPKASQKSAQPKATQPKRAPEPPKLAPPEPVKKAPAAQQCQKA